MLSGKCWPFCLGLNVLSQLKVKTRIDVSESKAVFLDNLQLSELVFYWPILSNKHHGLAQSFNSSPKACNLHIIYGVLLLKGTSSQPHCIQSSWRRNVKVRWVQNITSIIDKFSFLCLKNNLYSAWSNMIIYSYTLKITCWKWECKISFWTSFMKIYWHLTIWPWSGQGQQMAIPVHICQVFYGKMITRASGS